MRSYSIEKGIIKRFEEFFLGLGGGILTNLSFSTKDIAFSGKMQGEVTVQ